MARNIWNVRHLPRYGWNPIVLAPRHGDGELDPATMELVPRELKVLRTSWLEPRRLHSIAVALRRLQRGLSARGRLLESSAARGLATPSPSPSAAADLEGAIGPPSRLLRLQQFVFFPDNQVGWLPYALAAAIREYRSKCYQVVYSTSPPITAHLIALCLRKLLRVRWVAEFRDPWLGNAVTEAATPDRPWVHRRLQSWMERVIVGSADRLVFVSASTTETYRRRYPRAADMVTITSGYERTEAATPSTDRGGSERYRIAYTGTLDRPAELEIFLSGLDALVRRRPDLKDRIEVAFFGSVSNECRAVADRFATDCLEPVVRFFDFVPRRMALQAVADADAALVLLGSGPGMDLFIPGKLFDYIGQNSQILAMLPRGAARSVLERLAWGVICDPDPLDVERSIERLLAMPPPARRADPDGLYDRATLARHLAESFDDLLTLEHEEHLKQRADTGLPN